MKIIPQRYWYRILLAIVLFSFASLFLTLFLPYLGEEGQFTLSALEMSYHHYYWQPLSYGTYYWRPPLYHWLIIGAMKLTGAQSVLVAARLATACVSILLGLTLWFFSERLFHNKLFAVFSVAIFFSGDFLFRRGWIVSADPLFSLAVLMAISFMWLSYAEKRPLWWIPVPLALFAGVLIKALTVYVFYGTALMIVWLHAADRSYLFKPASLLAHGVALLLPILWFMYAPNSNWHAMIGDISHRAADGSHYWAYFKKLLSSPLDIVIRFAPVDLLVLYSLYQQKKNKTAVLPISPTVDAQPIKPLLWIIIISTLPYWLAPTPLQIRYLLPLAPFIALVFAYYIWRGGQQIVTVTIIVLLLELGFKYIANFMGLPWFEFMTYAHQQIANDIVKRTQNQPLYADNMISAAALSVAAGIDAARWPQPPLVLPPASFKQGCVVTPTENPQWGDLQQIYTEGPSGSVGSKTIFYLYCRGYPF